MSSCLCKNPEGASFPFQIKPLEYGVDDAVHALHVPEIVALLLHLKFALPQHGKDLPFIHFVLAVGTASIDVTQASHEPIKFPAVTRLGGKRT
jgi:hypothetical protein